MDPLFDHKGNPIGLPSEWHKNLERRRQAQSKMEKPVSTLNPLKNRPLPPVPLQHLKSRWSSSNLAEVMDGQNSPSTKNRRRLSFSEKIVEKIGKFSPGLAKFSKSFLNLSPSPSSTIRRNSAPIDRYLDAPIRGMKDSVKKTAKSSRHTRNASSPERKPPQELPHPSRFTGRFIDPNKPYEPTGDIIRSKFADTCNQVLRPGGMSYQVPLPKQSKLPAAFTNITDPFSPNQAEHFLNNLQREDEDLSERYHAEHEANPAMGPPVSVDFGTTQVYDTPARTKIGYNQKHDHRPVISAAAGTPFSKPTIGPASHYVEGARQVIARRPVPPPVIHTRNIPQSRSVSIERSSSKGSSRRPSQSGARRPSLSSDRRHSSKEHAPAPELYCHVNEQTSKQAFSRPSQSLARRLSFADNSRCVSPTGSMVSRTSSLSQMEPPSPTESMISRFNPNPIDNAFVRGNSRGKTRANSRDVTVPPPLFHKGSSSRESNRFEGLPLENKSGGRFEMRPLHYQAG
jgi:hypothetical protein